MFAPRSCRVRCGGDGNDDVDDQTELGGWWHERLQGSPPQIPTRRAERNKIAKKEEQKTLYNLPKC
jgi:hypothetical protein